MFAKTHLHEIARLDIARSKVSSRTLYVRGVCYTRGVYAVTTGRKRVMTRLPCSEGDFKALARESDDFRLASLRRVLISPAKVGR